MGLSPRFWTGFGQGLAAGLSPPTGHLPRSNTLSDDGAPGASKKLKFLTGEGGKMQMRSTLYRFLSPSSVEKL